MTAAAEVQLLMSAGRGPQEWTTSIWWPVAPAVLEGSTETRPAPRCGRPTARPPRPRPGADNQA